MPSKYIYLLAVPILLRLFKTRPLPSRERTIKPNEERVVLLGASSGVGKDLALTYAKRGARICLFARRKEALQDVKAECQRLGAKDVIVISGDITSPADLIAVRQQVIDDGQRQALRVMRRQSAEDHGPECLALRPAWGGIDTLHILAGVPSTQTLLDIAGSKLTASSSSTNPLARKTFGGDPDEDALNRVKVEAQICADINYLGTTISLATFLPLLSRSRSPVLHHLSSVAATVPAPKRAIYSATKAAGLMAVEACRVECEGSGVRFLSILPGTIDNGFRHKSATSETGGECEVANGVKSSLDGLLLPPHKVVEVIIEHIARNPAPTPLIPYLPFSLISALQLPPKHLVHVPWQYRMAALVRDTPLGWLYVEPAARQKYGIK